jgi:hypothetical protein
MPPPRGPSQAPQQTQPPQRRRLSEVSRCPDAGDRPLALRDACAVATYQRCGRTACLLDCRASRRRTAKSVMSAKRSVIPVRGTRYYQAGAAMAAGRLQFGTPLRLVLRPDNPYDSNAVEIHLTDGTLLGHVPRERSAEFFAHVRAGHVAAARILSARGRTPRIEIDVEVEFSVPVPQPPSPPPAARYSKRPEALRAVPSRRTQTMLSPQPPSQIRSTPTPTRAEGSRSWLWWVIGAIFLLWLLAQ